MFDRRHGLNCDHKAENKKRWPWTQQKNSNNNSTYTYIYIILIYLYKKKEYTRNIFTGKHFYYKHFQFSLYCFRTCLPALEDSQRNTKWGCLSAGHCFVWYFVSASIIWSVGDSPITVCSFCSETVKLYPIMGLEIWLFHVLPDLVGWGGMGWGLVGKSSIDRQNVFHDKSINATFCLQMLTGTFIGIDVELPVNTINYISWIHWEEGVWLRTWWKPCTFVLFVRYFEL